MPSPAAAAGSAGGTTRPSHLPLYLVSEPKTNRVFEREKPHHHPNKLDKRKRAFLFGLAIKLSLVLVVLYRKNELLLTQWVSSPPPSYCAALAEAANANAKPPAAATTTQTQPLVCAHSGDRDHPSPDSPDALREALAAGTGCVLLHVSSTADGELVVIRNTPAALGLLTLPPKGSALAQRAAALGSARRWWRQATVGDLTLEELRTLKWRRPTRKGRRRSAGGGGDDGLVLTLEQALRLLLLPPTPPATEHRRQQPLATLIVDLERPTGAARASVPLADFARRSVAVAKQGGCENPKKPENAAAVRCLFWAMQDDLVVEAGEAVGRLRKKKENKMRRTRGEGGAAAAAAAVAGDDGGGAPPQAYEPLAASGAPGLGYFVAERRDPRHPRLEGAASAAAVHYEMLRAGDGGGSAVARALHKKEQQVYAYLINRAAPLRAAVVAGADAIVTDRATQVSGVLGAWRRQCEAVAAAAAAGGRRRR